MVGPPSKKYRLTKSSELWIEKHSSAAQEAYRQRTGETIPIATIYPNSIADFRSEVQQLSNRCMTIEALGILSHGHSGYLLIGKDAITVQNIDEAFGRGLSCIMASDVAVEIAGCNLGRACEGAHFMLAAATRLLPKGGTITTSEHYVYGNAFLGIAPRSILGERQLRVDIDGDRPRWTPGSEPSLKCLESLKSTYARTLHSIR